MPRQTVIRIHCDSVRGGVPYKICPNCGERKPLDDFGLRTIRKSDGPDEVREQPWCRPCRSNRS